MIRALNVSADMRHSGKNTHFWFGYLELRDLIPVPTDAY